jgi:hypothetical protein
VYNLVTIVLQGMIELASSHGIGHDSDRCGFLRICPIDNEGILDVR